MHNCNYELVTKTGSIKTLNRGEKKSAAISCSAFYIL